MSTTPAHEESNESPNPPQNGLKDRDRARWKVFVGVLGLVVVLGMFRVGGISGKATGGQNMGGCGGPLDEGTPLLKTTQRTDPAKTNPALARMTKPNEAKALPLPQLLLKIKQDRQIRLANPSKQLVHKLAPKVWKGMKRPKPLPLAALLAKIKQDRQLRLANPPKQPVHNLSFKVWKGMKVSKPLSLPQLLLKIKESKASNPKVLQQNK